MQTKLLIDGALVAGEGAVERILDPATGQCIAEVPEATLSQMNAAVAGAEAAASAWAQTTGQKSVLRRPRCWRRSWDTGLGRRNPVISSARLPAPIVVVLVGTGTRTTRAAFR